LRSFPAQRFLGRWRCTPPSRESPLALVNLALAGDDDAELVKQRLAELGYHEGQNSIFDFHSAEGHLERLPELAAKLLVATPDVIVTGFGRETAKAAQAATAVIPIIFTGRW
jgi:putative tryptophan/tyrosine transport system substrate-binding protein